MLLDNFAQVYYYGPVWFQWAPTLGGECYKDSSQIQQMIAMRFNGHPPLGVNATSVSKGIALTKLIRFNGHPPLGVNATGTIVCRSTRWGEFQWAPTLGGECY